MSQTVDLSKKNRKEAPIILIKRANMTLKSKFLLYAIGLFVAIFLTSILIMAVGVNPIKYFSKIISGCFSSAINIRGLIRILAPLIITSLGVAVAFKIKFWNIGAEGQFIIGAICASWVGLSCGDMPQFLSLLLMFFASVVGSGMYALAIALLKVKFKTNETLLTLMSNYIALYFLMFLEMNVPYFRDASMGRPEFLKLPMSAWMYTIKFSARFYIDISIIIALVIAIILFVYFKYTKHGYEISVIGDSLNTAKYAGMQVNKVILRTIFLSGAIIGIAGMLQVSGEASSHVLSTGITGGVGWTAIIVAWLAKLNPFAIVGVSFLLSILNKGSSVAQSTFAISSSLSSIMQGVILFVMLSCDFFIRYKISFNISTNKVPTNKVPTNKVEVKE